MRSIPPPSVPPAYRLPEVAMEAVTIAIVSFAINISLASLYARQDKYSIDTGHELIAYGLSNVISSFFNCFTSSASLARSSVQHAVGGKTQVCIDAVCIDIK
jgi:MFS superfamily sulfate permease-like transporter